MMMDQMLKSTSDFAERMAKIEQEKVAHLRSQKSSIEGEISEVKYVDKDEVVQVRTTNTKNNSVRIDTENKIVTKRVFIVVFSDGREKEFKEPPQKPLNKGEYYIIEFNGMNEITSANIKD